MTVAQKRQPLSQHEIASAQFICDVAGTAENFPHFWEHTVGSGHAALALRADWQVQLRRCHEELGFRYVRFHGILSDDMGTLLIYDNKPLYSFHNADLIFDYLLSIGMKPFVELSFMPTGLASGGKTVFHYRGNVTPPKDHAQWAELIRRLVAHWVERYGAEEVRQWFFEVWNEPNLEAFYTGKLDDYLTLYRFTAETIKSVDKQLKVGGPATAKNAWIPEFVNFCHGNNVPVDFISTHHYPTDAFGKPGDDTMTQLSLSRRSVMREEAQAVKKQAGDLPVYYTEWCTSSNPRDSMHDEPYAAAFIVKTVMEAGGLVEGYSYWTFSDIFEENYFPSVPFHGGFGLLNIHGIAKPAYRAFQVLHDLGDKKLEVKGTHETVDAWSVRRKNSVTFLLTNFALPKHPIKTVTARVEIKNAGKSSKARLQRIDDESANPRRLWEGMGMPEYPTPAMVKELCAASEMKNETIDIDTKDNISHFEIDLLPFSVTAVTVDLS